MEGAMVSVAVSLWEAALSALTSLFLILSLWSKVCSMALFPATLCGVSGFLFVSLVVLSVLWLCPPFQQWYKSDWILGCTEILLELWAGKSSPLWIEGFFLTFLNKFQKKLHTTDHMTFLFLRHGLVWCILGKVLNHSNDLMTTRRQPSAWANWHREAQDEGTQKGHQDPQALQSYQGGWCQEICEHISPHICFLNRWETELCFLRSWPPSPSCAPSFIR
jgi:hypothetical protein